MYTALQIFNTVSEHLLTQMKKSNKNGAVGKYIGCAYRGSSGLKCSIGCLIPDELYTVDYEKKTVTDLVWMDKRLRPHLMPVDMRESLALAFLEELQALHDSVQPRNWSKGLESIANKFKLNQGGNNV